jgi:hypothetical protein
MGTLSRVGAAAIQASFSLAHILRSLSEDLAAFTQGRSANLGGDT